MTKIYFKQLLFAAVIFLTAQLSFGQITLIPDAVFEQELINNQYDDVLDGQVLTENISGMGSLYLYDLPISDLTGIQDFVGLQTLFVTQTSVTALNVSNLQALKTLNCGANNLNSLTVSGLQNLEQLFVGGNALTSVDLSNLPNLKEINVDLNPLTEMAITSPLVSYISAYQCNLQSIDVSGLPLLEVLYVGNNSIETLDVSGITPFRYLYCSNNEMTSLNVSGTNLTDLYVNGNLLSELNLKGQDGITSFAFVNNPLLYCIEVDDVAYFNSYPSWNKDPHATYRTDCNVIGIPDPNFEQALIDLGHDTIVDGAISKPAVAAITSLNVSYKNISDLSGVEQFPNLIELNCSNNAIYGDIFSNPALSGLQKLNCSDNPIYLLDISQMTSLTELNVSNTSLWTFEHGTLPSLQKLSCRNASMSALSVSEFPGLETLDCSHNSLYTLDLQQNPNLKSVDCSFNNLQNVPFTPDHPLEHFICNNNSLYRVETFNLPNLKELRCNNNSMYDLDIRNLSELEYLDISYNQISQIWSGTLPLLNTFVCNDNSIGKLQLGGFESLTTLHCQNNWLTFLNLRNTPIANLNCASNLLECVSLDNPEATPDNPNFQKDETTVFAESCQTGPFTQIPDQNFERVLMTDGHDEVLDGQVSTAAISGISFLSLYQAGVSDLTGIQDFITLANLDLQDNNLTNLNALSGMSWISSLYCSENPFVNLDVDGLDLSGVQRFHCSNSTLESIHFGNGMPNLQELYLYENQLQALDLSSLTNLSYAECNNNQLTSLTITGLQNLEEIICADNLLTGIDLSGVTNLGSIDCSNNQITELDFSETPNIYTIECWNNKITQLGLDGLSNLYTLNCSDNELTQIDVSDLLSLESFYCNNNQLTELNLNLANLYDLECSDNAISELDLTNAGNISQLRCDGNQIVSLLLNTSLSNISCGDNRITSLDLSGMQYLNVLTAENNRLTALDLTSHSSIYYFSAEDNPYLKCIKVDDAYNAANQSSWFINGDSYYSESCESCAKTTTWTGNAWIPDAPDADSAVFIDGTMNVMQDMEFCSLVLVDNAAMTVESGKNLRVANAVEVAPTAVFTMENNSNLLQTNSGAVNRGAATVKRDAVMRRLDYVYWASPVSAMNLLNFSPQTITNRFYTLNETTNQFVWVDPAVTDFGAAQGYMIRAANTFPANGAQATFNGTFTGTPNNGDLSIDVFHTDNKGFNLIGNPYPSTIDAQLFMDMNPDIDALYFWTHASQSPGASNYATFNATGATQAATALPDESPNGTIQVGQGFLAKMTAAAPQQMAINFTNDMRVANNENQFFRSSEFFEQNRIWLNLSDETKKLNQILTGYITNASDGIDSRYDGKLIETNGSKLYNLIENSEYVIQAKALPFSADDVVALGFKTDIAGSYSISLDHTDGIFNGEQAVYIKDNLNGTLHNIKLGAYTFASEAGTFNERFEIVYQSVLGIQQPKSATVVLFNSNNMLQVDSGIAPMNQIKVFDIQGRLIYERDSISANNIILTGLKPQNQVLLVQIKLDNETTITKKAVY